MGLISIFTSAILTQNIILTRFLGLCSFFGTSKSEKKALLMGGCVTFVMLISSIICYLVYHFVLKPYDIIYLRTISFILIIAIMVELIELILKKINPTLNDSLGIYLPLLTTNCAILGVCLLNINNAYSFMETIAFALGSSIGFTVVIYIFSTIQTRFEKINIPKCLKGYPISFITAGLMVLVLSRYIGV